MGQEKLGCQLGKGHCLPCTRPGGVVRALLSDPRAPLSPMMLAGFTTCTQPLGQQ